MAYPVAGQAPRPKREQPITRGGHLICPLRSAFSERDQLAATDGAEGDPTGFPLRLH